jgi:MFS transporter, OFA family, oxalate/formate antiporter
VNATASKQSPAVEGFLDNRWVILFFGILSMVAVANFQYGWTLFVKPLSAHLSKELALIQVTFTVFVLLETWLVPFEGWLVDKFGPKLLVIFGGVAAGIGWIGSGKAETLTALYLSYALAGIGAGIVYGTAVGSALKWFPDHRGLAAGLTAAGFGAGSAFTVAPIASMINPPGQPAGSGYQHAFVAWGIIQGITVIVAAFFLKAPPAGWLPKTWRQAPAGELVKKRQSTGDFSSGQMATTPQFWLMYLMMTMVATGGLMATAQLAPMAADFKVDKVNVSLLGLSMGALVFALSADRLINGLCRPLWGWVSDHIGREQTMTLAFGLEALAIFALIRFASNPTLFVVFSAFTFFGWGEIYSLFPALCGDFFGRKHATANYGFLYTAKGTASVFVPIGSALAAGKAFDFRADILLLLGGVLVLYSLFLAPTVLRLELSRAAKTTLLSVAGVILAWGLLLTVVPDKIWTPFAAKFTLPKMGWKGVYDVAIAFDLIAAMLAFVVLRTMKVPQLKAVAQPVTAGTSAELSPESASAPPGAEKAKGMAGGRY